LGERNGKEDLPGLTRVLRISFQKKNSALITKQTSASKGKIRGRVSAGEEVTGGKTLEHAVQAAERRGEGEGKAAAVQGKGG